MGLTLPTNPSTSTATVGKSYLLNINTGTASTPVWTLIGGQRASTLSRKGDSIDVSNKTNQGWKSSLIGLLSWSIALDGLVMLNDAGILALETAFNAGAQINVQFVYADGSYRTGWATISELTLDNQYNQAATLKGTLEGVGALSSVQPVISPATLTYSKSAATAQTFNVVPTTESLSTIANGSTALTVTTQYTYSSGVLTLTSTYLASLTVGTATITLTFSDGTTVTITLTITA